MPRLLQIINNIEEWTLVLIILGLAVVSFVQVLCRYLLGFSFTWMEELGRSLAVFIAFLGASIGVRQGAHFSMDLIYERVSKRSFPTWAPGGGACAFRGGVSCGGLVWLGTGHETARLRGADFGNGECRNTGPMCRSRFSR